MKTSPPCRRTRIFFTGSRPAVSARRHSSSREVPPEGPQQIGDLFGIYNPDDDGFNRYGLTLAGGYRWQAGQRIGLSYTGSRNRAQFDSAEYPPPNFLPELARKAIDNQLLEDYGIEGARGLLINISASQETFTMAEFMDKLSRVPLRYQPGTAWMYSLAVRYWRRSVTTPALS